MSVELRSGSSFQFSTRGLPVSEGHSTLRDLLDRKVRLNFEAPRDQPVGAEMTVQGFPGLRRATMVSNVDVRLVRGRAMLSDGEDDVCLIVKNGGGLRIEQRRQQRWATEYFWPTAKRPCYTSKR